jgi:GNAT superfamily N-acetyltransferase
VRIRQATDADVAELVEMARRRWLETPFAARFPPSLSKIEAVVRYTLAHGAGFVAEEHRLVGMFGVVCGTYPLSDTGIYADEVAWWVDPAWRGSNIGPRLLGAVEDWATTQGAEMLKLTAPAGSRLGQYLEHRQTGRFQAAETAYVRVLAPHAGTHDRRDARPPDDPIRE